MAVTLDGVALPDDIQWLDEFSGHGVGQQITPTLTGAIIVEENAQPEGRPMTLDSGDGSWADRSTVELLEVVAATPLDDGQTLLLEWADGRVFEVVFDRSRGTGFEASEVIRVAPAKHSADHKYYLKLTLLIKGVV